MTTGEYLTNICGFCGEPQLGVHYHEPTSAIDYVVGCETCGNYESHYWRCPEDPRCWGDIMGRRCLRKNDHTGPHHIYPQ